MTKEQFLKLVRDDKIYDPYANRTYIVSCVNHYDDNSKTIQIKDIYSNKPLINLNSYLSLECLNEVINSWVYLGHLSSVEKIQEKIDVLKLELSKLEAEKKSLEIQTGHFYEIEYKFGSLNKIGIFYVEAIRNGGDVVYVKTTRTYEYLGKESIISFKRISDISVIEEAWKNV